MKRTKRPLEGIFEGRGIKEFWEGAPKQESLLEWLGPPMTDEARADLWRTMLKDIGVGYIIKNGKVYKV